MTIQESTRAFSFGDVVNETFAVIGRNFLPFVALALVAALPEVIWAAFYSRLLGTTNGQITPNMVFTANYWVLMFATQLISIVFNFILQASLTYFSVMDMSGKPVSIGDAVAVAIKAFFPLVGLGILYSLGVGLAFILLVFPGFMILTAWFVVVPVYIVEKTSVFGAFPRSRVLTRGHRWAIFGLLIVFSVAVGVINLFARPIFGLPFASANISFPVGFLVATLVLRAAALVVSSTGSAVIYYLLRVSKEGVGAHELAAVFE